jgi:hypothetical protein
VVGHFLRSSSFRSRIRTVTKFRENTTSWRWIKCWKFKWKLRNCECSYIWTHYSYWWSWIFFLWNVWSKWLPKRKRAKNTDNVYRMGESHGDLCKRAVKIVLHLLLSNPTPIGNWVVRVYASSEFEETIALLLGLFVECWSLWYIIAAMLWLNDDTELYTEGLKIYCCLIS